ncbi:hypothetical protein R3P38DRAFT_3279434 [Favolaschia claudopus]|uniref:Uncharacterized protein n=1 Tax=Favolaschia claudopus TaxID=2862362 RepID=A0AAW0AJG8_9AGAR
MLPSLLLPPAAYPTTLAGFSDAKTPPAPYSSLAYLFKFLILKAERIQVIQEQGKGCRHVSSSLTYQVPSRLNLFNASQLLNISSSSPHPFPHQMHCNFWALSSSKTPSKFFCACEIWPQVLFKFNQTNSFFKPRLVVVDVSNIVCFSISGELPALPHFIPLSVPPPKRLPSCPNRSEFILCAVPMLTARAPSSIPAPRHGGSYDYVFMSSFIQYDSFLCPHKQDICRAIIGYEPLC